MSTDLATVILSCSSALNLLHVWAQLLCSGCCRPVSQCKYHRHIWAVVGDRWCNYLITYHHLISSVTRGHHWQVWRVYDEGDWAYSGPLYDAGSYVLKTWNKSAESRTGICHISSRLLTTTFHTIRIYVIIHIHAHGVANGYSDTSPSASSVSDNSSLKFTTAHSIPLIQLGTLVSSSIVNSLSLTKYHISLSLIIIIFVNFAVSAPIFTSKLPVPLPHLLFTLNLITATLSNTTFQNLK